MTVTIAIIYWILLILSVFTIIFSIPGTFLIVLLNLLYQLVDNVKGIDWHILLILLVISLFLELAELLITSWSSRKRGASRPGTIGAIIGSIAGAVIGTGVLPLIGSLLGAFIGAFLGAFLIEVIRSGDLNRSYQAGLGAFTGSVGAKLVKIVGAIVMLVIIT